MDTKTRNRLILGAAVVIAGAVIFYNMFFSLTPPRHADHDHAIAKLDAGGFLWLERSDGSRRNLVGVPGRVLVLHWFNPHSVNLAEEEAAARVATAYVGDEGVDFLFIAQAPDWEGVKSATAAAGVPEELLYLDVEGKTGDLCGVRRSPETLVYDPKGFLAYQSKGAAPWTGSAMRAQIERAKGGVDEIH